MCDGEIIIGEYVHDTWAYSDVFYWHTV